MRTTINIDEDVFEAAKAIASQQNKPLGKVISNLARRSLANSRQRVTRNGIPLQPNHFGASVVTLEVINTLRDE